MPGIDLVLGRHEHENWFLRRGSNFTPIVKAEANVRSVAIVTVTFGGAKTRPSVTARFDVLDRSIPPDAKIEGLVQKWTSFAFDGFGKGGFEPARVVARVTESLDGRESAVRNQQGRLTDLITGAFDREAGGVDVAILNGGSVCVDDVVQAGPVTEYDVLRILPFGGRIVRASGRRAPASRAGCGAGKPGQRRFPSRTRCGPRRKRVDDCGATPRCLRPIHRRNDRLPHERRGQQSRIF